MSGETTRALAETPVAAARHDFPALHQEIDGRPLVFLDSAASAQQPAPVIEAVREYSSHDHANVHRGVHTLSQRATDAYEGARDKCVAFINAASRREVVFTSGTTESINLVAASFAQPGIQPGDEILITHLEHHANIVPWQLLAERTGAKLIVAPITASGDLDLDAWSSLITTRTRLVSVAHVSNALGTVLPVNEIVRAARARGVAVLIDGAQGVPHGSVDVQAIGCDFYAFSAHKMYGPTGVGVLYAPRGATGRNAAVAGRRRHDRGGQFRRHDVQ